MLPTEAMTRYGVKIVSTSALSCLVIILLVAQISLYSDQIYEDRKHAWLVEAEKERLRSLVYRKSSSAMTAVAKMSMDSRARWQENLR